MAFSNRKFCPICGKELSLLNRMKLGDGTFICGNCARLIPGHMKASVKAEYTLRGLNAFLDYCQYSNNHLRPIFHETHRYYNIGVDINNLIFYIGYTVDSKTVFYNFRNVSVFDLVFKAEEFKEGVFSSSVKGEILMEIEVDQPRFRHEEVLDPFAKTNAKKVMFGTKVSYADPPAMVEFLQVFLDGCIMSREQETYNDPCAQNQWDSFTNSNELQQAMILFMIDRIEDITIERIRQQRNRLIKTFHPDIGSTQDTDYAQKINRAYEILQQYTK